MSMVKISAFAFAFALSAGSASAQCTLEAASACADMAKETTVTQRDQAIVGEDFVNVSTASAVTEGCGTACVCPETGKVIQTVAEVGAETRSIPGGGVEILSASTDASSTKGYKVGDKVSDFSVKHAQSGNEVSLSDLAGEKATVVIFWNNLCPYVEGGPAAAGDRVREFTKQYADKGVNVVAIDAGVDKTEEDLIKYAADQPFPILVNRDSSLAAKFNAQYTPHTFVLDSNMNVVYEGGFDSGGRKDENGNVEPWTRNAVNDVLIGNKPAVASRRGIGCTIKWAPGARPTT